MNSVRLGDFVTNVTTPDSPDFVPAPERIAARPTPEILGRQAGIIAAVKPFPFSPAGAAVCRRGPFGAAAKQLKEWKSGP